MNEVSTNPKKSKPNISKKCSHMNGECSPSRNVLSGVVFLDESQRKNGVHPRGGENHIVNTRCYLLIRCDIHRL